MNGPPANRLLVLVILLTMHHSHLIQLQSEHTAVVREEGGDFEPEDFGWSRPSGLHNNRSRVSRLYPLR